MQRETKYDAVFDAQQYYRLLLDAMARPGKINELPRMVLAPPPGISATAVLVGFALLDADVCFHTVDDDVAGYLTGNTAARRERAEQADFVFSSGDAALALLRGIKRGTLSYPDEGATLVLDVAALGDLATGLSLTVSGPGVAGEKSFSVGGLSVALLEALQECNAEFPLGIDVILTDPAYRIACIPRSSRLGWTIL